jgi:hypothetical protein
MAQFLHLLRKNEENHKNNGTASLLAEILRRDLPITKQQCSTTTPQQKRNIGSVDTSIKLHTFLA